MPPHKIRAHVMISGRVQGVFFRAETREKARQVGISGWVRNTPDNRVEALFEMLFLFSPYTFSLMPYASCRQVLEKSPLPGPSALHPAPKYSLSPQRTAYPMITTITSETMRTQKKRSTAMVVTVSVS